MDLNITYQNSAGQKLIFGLAEIHYKDNDFHNYEWSYREVSEKLHSFSRGITRFTIEGALRTNGRGLEMRDEFVDILDYDVRENKPGTISINGWAISAYCVSNVKDSWWFSDEVMAFELEFVSDSKMWQRSISQEFYPATGAGDAGIDYPYAYPRDYAPNSTVQTVKVSGRHASNFVMVAYGPVVNPAVIIGGHTYRVNVEVPAGGFLVIDSSKKTVTLVNASGIASNVFNKQDKTSYLFEKIPAGESVVSWSGQDFGFTLTVVEERSEPSWT